MAVGDIIIVQSRCVMVDAAFNDTVRAPFWYVYEMTHDARAFVICVYFIFVAVERDVSAVHSVQHKGDSPV